MDMTKEEKHIDRIMRRLIKVCQSTGATVGDFLAASHLVVSEFLDLEEDVSVTLCDAYMKMVKDAHVQSGGCAGCRGKAHPHDGQNRIN